MPSTYTANNALTLQAFNENPSTWGTIANTVFSLIDASLDGAEAVDVSGSGATATLTITDGADAPARARVLNFTGARTVTNITVTIGPNTAEKIYWVKNSTTGGFSVILAQGSGSTVTIAPGAWALVFLNGAGSGASVTTLTSLSLAGSTSGMTTVQPSATASGTLTLPAATDTLVGRATTDTLTNKTFDTAGTGNVLRINGTQVSAVTGTGSAVLANSPTIATPTITTSATAPLVIGGTGTTSTLALRSTSGVGTTGADIIFQTGNNGATEAMRILNGGNVGIANPSPAYTLDVTGTKRCTGRSLASYGVFSGTLSTYDASAGAVYVGFASGGYIRSVSNNSGAASSLGFQIDNAGTNRIFIDTAGNVGVGLTSISYQFQVATDSAAKPSTNTWTIASDARLKTVKGEYTKGLTEICQIRPVRYEYNGKGGFDADGKEQISILAQELMQVFPECVGTFRGKLTEEGPETDLYNYNGHAITFALINAIKELKAEIDLLKAAQ